MPDKFEIEKDIAGKFRFNFIAANGEIIVSSEAYETKEACKNGIQSVKRDAPTAETVDSSLYCGWCGTPITSGIPFCTNCGRSIRQDELKPQTPTVPQSPRRVIPVRSILVIVVVLMAGVAAGSFMVRPNAPSAVAQNQILTQNNIVSVSSPTFTVVTSSAIIYSSATTYAPPVTTLTPASSTSSAIIYSSATYAPSTSRSGCDPSYPTVCIPPPPPDLDCKDITYRNFVVLPPDPHHFDGDHDGYGCET